jgi:hypothetical protein
VSRQDDVQALLRASSKEDGQPCLGCPHSAACADLELACRAFRAWIQGLSAAGRQREPSRRDFQLAMFGE